MQEMFAAASMDGVLGDLISAGVAMIGILLIVCGVLTLARFLFMAGNREEKEEEEEREGGRYGV